MSRISSPKWLSHFGGRGKKGGHLLILSVAVRQGILKGGMEHIVCFLWITKLKKKLKMTQDLMQDTTHLHISTHMFLQRPDTQQPHTCTHAGRQACTHPCTHARACMHAQLKISIERVHARTPTHHTRTHISNTGAAHSSHIGNHTSTHAQMHAQA